MKKIYQTLLKCIIAIIIIANVPFLTHLFSFFLDKGHFEDYRYSNADGGFMQRLEFKGPHFEDIKSQHQKYIDSFPEKKDKGLYRLYWKSPLKFWRWGIYFYDERYQLPFKDMDEIRKIRGEKWVEKKYHFEK